VRFTASCGSKTRLRDFASARTAPQEIGMPFLVIPALALVPLIVATGIEAVIGRSSPSLEEHLAGTVACGLALGLALTWLVVVVRRGAARAS
jgi:hypothetical protein